MTKLRSPRLPLGLYSLLPFLRSCTNIWELLRWWRWCLNPCLPLQLHANPSWNSRGFLAEHLSICHNFDKWIANSYKDSRVQLLWLTRPMDRPLTCWMKLSKRHPANKPKVDVVQSIADLFHFPILLGIFSTNTRPVNNYYRPCYSKERQRH